MDVWAVEQGERRVNFHGTFDSGIQSIGSARNWAALWSLLSLPLDHGMDILKKDRYIMKQSF